MAFRTTRWANDAGTDYEVAAPTVQVDYTFWTCMSYSQSQVLILSVRGVLQLMSRRSYISEAAASLLDERLDLHIVPRTQLVSLSSPIRTHIAAVQKPAQFSFRHSSMTGSTVKRRRRGSLFPRRSEVCNTSCTASQVRSWRVTPASLPSYPARRFF